MTAELSQFRSWKGRGQMDAPMDRIARLAAVSIAVGVVVLLSVWLAMCRPGGESTSAGPEGRANRFQKVSSPSHALRKLDELEAQLMAAPVRGEALRQYNDAVVDGFVHRESDQAAEQLVERAENVLHRLKPSVPDGTKPFNELVETVAFYRRVIEADRRPLEEFEERLNAAPDDVEAILNYEVKVQRDYDNRFERAPDQAMANLSAAREFLQALKRKASDKKVLETIDGLLDGIIPARERRGRDAVPRLAWIGKEAAPLTGIDAWVNGGSLSENDLRGKVVLLDFFAVWCEPCIKAFPELRAWHDTYCDRGLVIVAVTQYYDYTWDAAANSPVHSSEHVPPEVERAMLKKFAEHYALPFRFAVEGEGALSGAYKVRGVPHVVLIDRQGIVRLVRTGAEFATAEEIDKMITLLISE
jgi:thiol-disulfide isomerase/thioredoxin